MLPQSALRRRSRHLAAADGGVAGALADVYKRQDLVWGFTYAGDYRTVDVHIRRLREKLEHDPAEDVYKRQVLELPAMTLVSRLQKRFSPGFFLRFAAGAEVVKFLIFYLSLIHI